MAEPSSHDWIQHWLFRLTLGMAACLALAVLLAPWYPGLDDQRGWWFRFVELFARDAVVRRTALAAACGLVATAFVFFRRRVRSLSVNQASHVDRAGG